MTARGQLDYSQPLPAIAGMLVDGGPKFDATGVNTESTSPIRFGIFVKKDSATKKGVKLLAAVSDKPIGVTGFKHTYDRLQDLDDTTGGVNPGVDLAIRQFGIVWVRVEGTIAYGDRAHVRVVSGSGGTVLGVARAAAVSGETIDCSNLGFFVGPDDGGTTPERFAPFFILGFSDLNTSNQELADGSVKVAKLSTFKSTEQTGTGSSQNIAHGLGVTPGLVIVEVTDTSPSTAGVYTMTEGTHDATNVVVTVTSGKKFKVIAFA
jgi:hypothetical protein